MLDLILDNKNKEYIEVLFDSLKKEGKIIEPLGLLFVTTTTPYALNQQWEKISSVFLQMYDLINKRRGKLKLSHYFDKETRKVAREIYSLLKSQEFSPDDVVNKIRGLAESIIQRYGSSSKSEIIKSVVELAQELKENIDIYNTLKAVYNAVSSSLRTYVENIAKAQIQSLLARQMVDILKDCGIDKLDLSLGKYSIEIRKDENKNTYKILIGEKGFIRSKTVAKYQIDAK